MRTIVKSINYYWLLLFWGLQLVVWTLLPTFFRHNVPFDTAEGIVWGNQWQWGYDKHPPLAAWLSALFTNIGHTVGWPVYLLAQIAIIVTFWAMWQIAKKILSKEQAIISVLLLFGCLYYSYPSITTKFHPTALMSPVWALTMLVLYSVLTKPRVWLWILLGLLAALSMLTKYESIILLACIVLVMLTTKEGLNSFKTYGPFLALWVFVLALLPHFIWAVQHNFPEIKYAAWSIGKRQLHPLILNHIVFPLRFLMEQLSSLLPMLLLLIPFFVASKKAKGFSQGISQNTFLARVVKKLHFQLLLKEGKPYPKFESRFLLIMGLGPLALTLLLSVVRGYFLSAGWGTPYFVLSGVLVMFFWRPIINIKAFKQFIIVLSILFLGIILSRGIHAYQASKTISGYPYNFTDMFYPGKEIASDLTKRWHDKYHTKLAYLVGDHYLLVSIAAYSKDRPAPYFNMSKVESPWVKETDLRKKGGMFLWDVHSNERVAQRSYHDLKKKFPRLGALTFATYRFASISKAWAKLGIAMLPSS